MEPGPAACEPPTVRSRVGVAVVVALSAGAVAAPVAGAGSAQPAAPKATTILRGVFTDSAKYTGSGTGTVTRRAAVRTLRLARNFRADPRSIRLRMYLATDATGRTHIDLGPMAESGAQAFRVPKAVSLTRYRYAIAWCAAVDEPITQARLVPVRR
jgi:hypothetical protein